MTRARLLYLTIAVLAVIIGVAIARNTYWDEVTVQNPPRGAATKDPYYATRQLLKRFGIGAGQLVSLRQLPPRDGVLLAPDIGDESLRTELDRVERWVEGGGRLIVAGDDIRASPRLQAWSGIAPAAHFVAEDQQEPDSDDPCQALDVRIDGKPSGERLRACIGDSELSFASRRIPAWSLSNIYGMQMLRVAVGRGSVTVLECECLVKNGSVLRADHARILFAAAPLRRGDRLTFADFGEAESIAALLWRLAAPALIAAGAALALVLWRSWPRFGPLEPAALPVRRSLAEQIRANARFAWRTRTLGSLGHATRRALERTARRRIAAYERLDGRGRIDSIARHTGLEADALRAAFGEPAGGDAEAESAAIWLLERARRSLESGSSKIQGV